MSCSLWQQGSIKGLVPLVLLVPLVSLEALVLSNL